MRQDLEQVSSRQMIRSKRLRQQFVEYPLFRSQDRVVAIVLHLGNSSGDVSVSVTS